MDEPRIAALRYLLRNLGGGYTASLIARECGHRGQRREALFRINVLGHLLKAGLVKLLDDEKPAIYGLTPAGRAVLAAEGE